MAHGQFEQQTWAQPSGWWFMSKETECARAFLRQAGKHLREEFMPKIRACVESLSEEEIWWRPNDRSNSVGNILLHLSGNVRQWIISGVGQTQDIRLREAEFSETGPVPKAELLNGLESTVKEALAVLERVNPGQLLETRQIQVYDTSVLQAIFHVVEHFSGHTGQIIYVTKLLKDKDCRFYDL
jgi:uncharacterized damage-inducible protein DinB